MDDESKKTPGILIGYKGVKYGLQKRKTAAAPKPAIFGDDSSEDEAVDVQIAKEQQKHLTASKVAAARAAAIAEDSTVYEYDSVYDDIQRNREARKRKDVEERKPKYIQQLMQKAEIRKKEQDLAYERRMLKERKQDDHLYESKEAFLTAAYKKKLVEDKFWIERERRLDAVEAAEDVTKKSDLSGFYQNLCTKNVAFASNRLAPQLSTESESPTIPDTLPAQPLTLPPESEPTQTAKKSIQDLEQIPTELPKHLQGTQSSPQSTAPPPDRSKRRNDASSIASARERYLSRKKTRRTEPEPSL